MKCYPIKFLFLKNGKVYLFFRQNYKSSSVACSSCNPIFFSNAALQASEALSIFAILNIPNRNLVAVEDLELFSHGRLVTIVSNSSLCSVSEAVVDEDVDGFRLQQGQFAKILGGN